MGTIQIVGISAGIIAAIATSMAAFAAWKAVAATKTASEAQLLFNTLNGYRQSKEVRNYVHILAGLPVDPESIKKWKKARDDQLSGDPDEESHVMRVDAARRYLKSFFTAIDLFQDGYVKEKFVESVVRLDGSKILIEKAWPLERVLEYTPLDDDRFRKIEKFVARRSEYIEQLRSTL